MVKSQPNFKDMSIFKEISENFSEEQKHQVDKAIDVIQRIISHESLDTRKDLFKALGVFDQQGMPLLYSILLNYEELPFDEADEIFESMGDEDVRTEIVIRLKNLGVFTLT